MLALLAFAAFQSLAGLGCSEVASPLSPSNPSSGDDDSKADGARTGEVRIRMMAANISSGTQQSYEDPGIRIFKGIAPDVVMIQEMNYQSNTAAQLRAFVDQAFGSDYSYWREAGAQIPNGVISRYPIVASGEWDDPRVGNRDFAWARIDIPGPTDLYVVSVHLLTASPEERNLEAAVLVEKLRSLPANSFVVLGGDFNTKERAEPCIGTLGQVLSTSGPFPTDHAGVEGTNASRSKPYDWVLANAALDAREIPVVIGASTFPDGLVVDSRVYVPLGEIAPVLATDSAASNMQHMAVVRDFVIPTDDPTPPPDPTLAVTAPNGGESWAAGSDHAITWTATDVASVKIEVSLDGASWTTLAASVPASPASFTWTVPATTTTAGRVRVSDAAGGAATDASDGPFSITSTPPPSGKVFINEVLANEPGSDPAGEFVEIVNGTDATVDLSGWTVADALRVRHTFAAGTTLAPGRAVVVYGAAAGIPAGVVAVPASTGTLAITNSADSVTLAGAGGASVDTMGFASSAKDGQSLNRNPDASATGGWVLHDTLAPGRLASPGTRADGGAFGGGTDPDDPPPPSGITAESEPNDTSSAADGPVGDAVEIAGTIGSSTDVDWYTVDLPAAGRITIDLAITGSADLDWYLYEAASPTSYVARGYTTNDPETGSYDAAAGSYLIKVVGYQGAQAPYALNVLLP